MLSSSSPDVLQSYALFLRLDEKAAVSMLLEARGLEDYYQVHPGK